MIADGLGTVHVWQLVEAGIAIQIQCDACNHTAEWTPGMIDRRLRSRRGQTLNMIAAKLRCEQCRSEYVHIGRFASATTRGGGLPFDPGGRSPFCIGE